ncbi:MAG: LptF/LptG family permease [Treponema sp.]|jgi:lipopolysaccharide export system permease protein|nr:LptF/LptG family permease [Treponema sp.]
MKSNRSISRIIFKSIVKEAAFSFLVSFLFFFFIFFVNQLLYMAQDILSKRVPFYQVALLVLYSLPAVIAMAAPFGALVGTLMTVGRLSSDNEILVMLSLGLSYINVFLPAFVVGIAISLISFFANDVLLPAGTIQYSRLYRRILSATPALELESNSIKRFDNTVLVIGNVAGTSIDDMLILDRTSEGERRMILADNAELKDAGIIGLSLNLSDAFIQTSREVARENYDYASTSFLQYTVPQADFFEDNYAITPNQMSSKDVKNDIKEKEADLNSIIAKRQMNSINNIMKLEEVLRRGSKDQTWNTRKSLASNLLQEKEYVSEIKEDRSLLNNKLEYYKKFSIPFGAFCFMFLAVPIGLFSRKSGQAKGFIFGLFIAFFYWAFLLGGQQGARLGFSPFWSMWLPNIIAISVGSVLAMIKVRQ